MAKSKPTSEQEPKVEVRLHWQPRGTAMESQLLDQPLYAHLPWTGEMDAEFAVQTASIAGRCAINTDASIAPAGQSGPRPPVVVSAKAEKGKQLQVRFQFLHHSLHFSAGHWHGTSAPGLAAASAWLPMTEGKATAKPSAPTSGAPVPATSAAATQRIPYYSAPIDALNLVEWLESAEATSSLRLATAQLAVYAQDRPALVRPGLARLALLTGDGRDAKGDPPGILPAYAPLKQPWSMYLPSPAAGTRRPLRIAWVHTEEYWRDPAQGGKLRPVYRAADTALVFAANLGNDLQFVEHGGAMLGRFAKIDPESGQEARAGWLASAVDIDAMDGAAATDALNSAPVGSLTAEQVACPWPAGPALARHRAAMAQPSAKQILLCGGLMAVRAEVAAFDEVPAGDQGPPNITSLGTFDFLVRHPADVIYAMAHQRADCLAVGRSGALGYKDFLNLPKWLNALEADRGSTRAPWAQALPEQPAPEEGPTRRSSTPLMAPVLALMSCNAADHGDLSQALLAATAPPRTGTKAGLAAIFGAHGTRPVWEFCLPFGRGAAAGTTAMVGLQAALAGRAIGVILGEVLKANGSCAQQRGRGARWTTNAQIRRAIRTYAYWTGVLSSGQMNVGLVYSIWGNLDPERAVPGLLKGIPGSYHVRMGADVSYPLLESVCPESELLLRKFLMFYQIALAGLVARRSVYFAKILSSTQAFALVEK